MKPLNLIYTIRIGLGALTAILCLLFGINSILTGVALSIVIYLSSDRILRQIFMGKVETQSAITKTGIGIYIITWLFLWILLFTFSYTPVQL